MNDLCDELNLSSPDDKVILGVGFIAVGPIPLEMDRRRNPVNPPPAPPVPSPVTQRKDGKFTAPTAFLFILTKFWISNSSDNFPVPTKMKEGQ